MIAHWMLVFMMYGSQTSPHSIPMVDQKVCERQRDFIKQDGLVRAVYCIQTGY